MFQARFPRGKTYRISSYYNGIYYIGLHESGCVLAGEAAAQPTELGCLSTLPCAGGMERFCC